MGKVTVSIEIEASPEKVFAFVTDMEKMNNVTKELVVCKLTSNGPIGLGSTAHFTATAWYDKGGEWNAVVNRIYKEQKHNHGS